MQMLHGIVRPSDKLSSACEPPASGDLFAGVGVTALPRSSLLWWQILYYRKFSMDWTSLKQMMSLLPMAIAGLT